MKRPAATAEKSEAILRAIMGIVDGDPAKTIYTAESPGEGRGSLRMTCVEVVLGSAIGSCVGVWALMALDSLWWHWKRRGQ